jgi:monoamine oxidase
VSVAEASDGTYTLTFADGSEVTADIVVLAIPFTTLREVDLSFDMPEVKRRAIDELGYGTNAKMALTLWWPPK